MVEAISGTHMTTAADVHLFDWIKVNSPFLGPLLLLFIGMVAGWIKVMVSRYPTRKELHQTMDDKITACQLLSAKRADKIENEQHNIVVAVDNMRKEVIARVDRIDSDNKVEHSAITKMIVELHK